MQEETALSDLISALWYLSSKAPYPNFLIDFLTDHCCSICRKRPEEAFTLLWQISALPLSCLPWIFVRPQTLRYLYRLSLRSWQLVANLDWPKDSLILSLTFPAIPISLYTFRVDPSESTKSASVPFPENPCNWMNRAFGHSFEKRVWVEWNKLSKLWAGSDVGYAFFLPHKLSFFRYKSFLI